MKQRILCTFMFLKPYHNNENAYTCIVEHQTVIENAELEFIVVHKEGKSNLDVTGLMFNWCTISKIHPGLAKTFPNLKILEIYNSNLKHVERIDLKELSQLEILLFQQNEIKLLRNDLLADMKCLEYLSFYNNKIEIIEPNLLDGLHKLRYANFSSNPCIDMRFDSISKCGNATLEEIKRAIRQKYFNKTSANLKPELENGICSDLKCIIQNENLKDFTVKVEGEEFKVHKMVLAARSPTILAMIESNVDATSLNIDDISVGIFRMILNYMYTDELPASNADFVNLFIAADKLKIDKLKEFAVEKLIKKINAENALEILTLANKYDHEKLRQKSFEQIKNTIGDKIIDAYLAKQTDLLKTLMQLEKEQDEMDESCEFDETDESCEFDETAESCESCEFD